MEMKILQAETEIKGGIMTAIASTDDIDRVGDSLSVDNWDFKNFKKNPVLLGGHNYQPEYVIGVAENIRVENNKVLFEPRFHDITEYARQIKKMFEDKILKAWSVGFLPKGTEKSQTFELLEVSAVAVPANPEALTLYQKALDLAKKEDVSVIEEWLKKKKIETKSPKCRLLTESKDECMSRKIGEMMEEDSNMAQDQAVAIAEKYCSIACDENGNPPAKAVEGDSCKLEDGSDGKYKTDNDGNLVCMPVDEGTGVPDGEVGGKSIDKLKEELMQLKEGRVLSGKNRELISKTILALNGVSNMLEKLLEETTTTVAETSIDTPRANAQKKGISNSKETTSQIKDRIMVGALKKLNKITSHTLGEFNKLK